MNRLVIKLILNVILITQTSSKKRFYGPSGVEDYESTTCAQFSENARFNPNSILDSEWMVFYYWGPPSRIIFYWFYIPDQKRLQYFKNLLDGHVKEAINWTSKYVVMKERDNFTSLLVERTDRGEYDLYIPYGGLRHGDMVDPIDVRFKQTGDNRYIGMMVCRADQVFVMARLKDVPRKNDIQDAASRIGYRGRGGKSYLYRGHQWMPIAEADDRLYWKPPNLKRMYMGDYY